MAKPKFDVYQHVTDTIIAEIEAGTPPWRKPWSGGGSALQLPLRHNGEPYRGINVLMLWIAAAQAGFTSARWMTFKQAKELGGHVRKGEQSATVVKYGSFEKADAEGNEQTIPYARAYRVFNADQIDGLPADYHSMPEPLREPGADALPEIVSFVQAAGARVETSSKPQAYYDVAGDFIHMPLASTFFTSEGHASTLLHEAVHWTGVEKRLDRFGRFSDRKAYAFEELVAELGSAMLSVHFDLTPEFDQHASYIESWVAALKEDRRVIFRAASEAQKAMDYLLEKANERSSNAA